MALGSVSVVGDCDSVPALWLDARLPIRCEDEERGSGKVLPVPDCVVRGLAKSSHVVRSQSLVGVSCWNVKKG